MLEMFVIPYSTLVFDTISFRWYLRFKGNKHKCNFHYVAIPMMMSQILKSVDFTKTQKSRYLENETLFFLQIKNSLITHQGLLYCKKQFCRVGNFCFWYYGLLLYYGIVFKTLGKNKNKLGTIYHFTDSCQEKSVNSQELFIYPSFGKFWGFFL